MDDIMEARVLGLQRWCGDNGLELLSEKEGNGEYSVGICQNGKPVYAFSMDEDTQTFHKIPATLRCGTMGDPKQCLLEFLDDWKAEGLLGTEWIKLDLAGLETIGRSRRSLPSYTK